MKYTIEEAQTDLARMFAQMIINEEEKEDEKNRNNQN